MHKHVYTTILPRVDLFPKFKSSTTTAPKIGSVFQGAKDRLPTHPPAPTLHQRRRMSHSHIQGSLRGRPRQHQTILPYRLMVPAYPANYDNAEFSAPIPFKSLPLCQITTHWRVQLQSKSSHPAWNKGNSARDTICAQDVGTSRC